MEPKTKKWKKELKTKKRICSEVSVQSGESRVSLEEGKEGYVGMDLQNSKVLSLEWKSEGVMDDEMEQLWEVPLTRWIRIGEISVWLAERSQDDLSSTGWDLL